MNKFHYIYISIIVLLLNVGCSKPGMNEDDTFSPFCNFLMLNHGLAVDKIRLDAFYLFCFCAVF